MDELPAAAQAALDQPVVRTHWLLYADIIGDVLRVTDAPYPLGFASDVDDPLLAGQTFGKVSALLEVSGVQHRTGGTDNLTFVCSGIPGIDTETLTAIGDRAAWRGRRAAAWLCVLEPDTLELLGIKRIFRGRMTNLRIGIEADSQTIVLDIASAGALLGEAGNSSYLDQARIDAGDTMVQAMLAAAAGARGSRSAPPADWEGGFDINNFPRFEP
jgi:hypothetical protein